MRGYTTFYLADAIPTKYAMAESLVAARFQPIDVDAGKYSAGGWVYDDGDLLPHAAEEIDWNLTFPTPLVVVGWRHEEINVPSPIVKREVTKRIADLGGAVTDDQRDAIENDVRISLRKRAVPDVTIVRIIIDETSRRFYIGLCSTSLREDIVAALDPGLGVRGTINSPFAAAVLDHPQGAVVIAATWPGHSHECRFGGDA